ncbi:MAG: MarR family transcriptional regulator [Phenylobacterium sp.]|uniref:MarR family winged helix-turn-helix transcriptional regulator n=1 Tax=Phenylobacterium sp. TaxID=1871053 RepID=UPI0011FB148B|nr:MarR family transcriptional regulator [Phenylobacterium sp.]TAJ69852.1 MAG: MarR family transcriptional regulator [Phenylobacterium sp.]
MTTSAQTAAPPAAAPPAAKTPGLDDFLCFAVYSANLAFGRAYKPLIESLGLASYTQFIAIVALSEEDNQSVGALGEKLFLESNTLTPILKKLEALGYVSRRRDPADERQVIVSLTPEGRRVREMARTPQASLRIDSGLGEDFPVVQKLMVRLRDNLLRALRGQQPD